MIDRDNTCRACDGSGKLGDDEGWQYACSVCYGNGDLQSVDIPNEARIMEVDENNRLLN